MIGTADATVFQSPVYLEARASRLRNLFHHVAPQTLRGRSVLETGCGTGEIGEEFVRLGCQVVSVDAVPQYVAELKRNYPNREAHVMDLDNWDPTPLGKFDIVVCFGLLYHLCRPTAFLAACARIAGDIFLETQVCDSEELSCYLVSEKGADQAFSPLGCRPTPGWIRLIMNHFGFEVRDISSPLANWGGISPSVFDWEPRNDGGLVRDGTYLRKMYICSRRRATSQGGGGG